MTQIEIAEILRLIDEWILTISDVESLREQCRKSGNDFFSFMTSRGVKAPYLAKLIQEKTGFHARNLHTRADAEQLRSAIYSYESVPAIVRDEEKKSGKQMNKKEAERTAWKHF